MTWKRSNRLSPRALQARVDAIEEILNMTSVRSRELIVRLSELLKGLPDLAKGLCRIQYGKVSVISPVPPNGPLMGYPVSTEGVCFSCESLQQDCRCV